MSKKDLKRVARAVANLDGSDQCKIIHSSDDELPKILQNLGISLPPSNWWLIVIKILLYGIGLFLCGFGTSAAAQTLNLF